MYTFIEKGIRKCLSQYMKGQAKVNNKFMDSFNKTQSSNYLMYLDSNNLYGWTRSQNIPEKGFTFINISDNLKENNTSDY